MRLDYGNEYATIVISAGIHIMMEIILIPTGSATGTASRRTHKLKPRDATSTHKPKVRDARSTHKRKPPNALQWARLPPTR